MDGDYVVVTISARWMGIIKSFVVDVFWQKGS